VWHCTDRGHGCGRGGSDVGGGGSVAMVGECVVVGRQRVGESGGTSECGDMVQCRVPLGFKAQPHVVFGLKMVYTLTIIPPLRMPIPAPRPAFAPAGSTITANTPVTLPLPRLTSTSGTRHVSTL
jgi:hypothetical protein